LGLTLNQLPAEFSLLSTIRLLLRTYTFKQSYGRSSQPKQSARSKRFGRRTKRRESSRVLPPSSLGCHRDSDIRSHPLLRPNTALPGKKKLGDRLSTIMSPAIQPPRSPLTQESFR
jgi:hypothetical protein